MYLHSDLFGVPDRHGTVRIAGQYTPDGRIETIEGLRPRFSTPTTPSISIHEDAASQVAGTYLHPNWYRNDVYLPYVPDASYFFIDKVLRVGTGADDTLRPVDPASANVRNVYYGNAGNDTLFGGFSNDTYVFNQGDGVDTIIDSVGGNTLVFGPGIDAGSIRLGLGSLVIRIGDSGDAVHIEGFDPDDPYNSLSIRYFEFDDGTLLTHGDLLNIGFDFTGTDGDDVLVGTGAPDRMHGLGGNDHLLAKNGDDLLDGGTGADVMEGGGGHDTYIVDDIGDAVIETAPYPWLGGIDTVVSSVDYSLGSYLENLTLTGTADLTGSGNAYGNVILGNDGNNTLFGHEGDDTLDGGVGADAMAGGVGNDTYTVDNIGDVTDETDGGGIDEVSASITHTIGPDIENLTLIGDDPIDGTGNNLDNRITGNWAANVLSGLNGNDYLDGGWGPIP